MYDIKIVNLKKVQHESIKCNFGLVINDCIELYGFKLIYYKDKDVYFISFPNYQYNNKYYNYVKLSSSLNNQVLSEVLKSYNGVDIL